MAQIDINCFEKVMDLFETEDELVYEVIQKGNPGRKFTLKIYKNPEEISRIMDLTDFLYKTNSDKLNSYKLHYFPRLYFDFKCWEKNTNQMNYALVFEFVPLSLRNYINKFSQNEKQNILIPFKKIYSFYQTFVNALAFLELHGMFHGRLSPDVIGFYFDENLKFMDLEKFSSGIGCITKEELPFREKNIYGAPEILMALNSKKNIIFNGNKADVFSMAVIILKLAKEKINKYLNLHDLDQEIKQKIENLKDKYASNLEPQFDEIFEKFLKILQKCLNSDPERRPTPLELFRKSLKFANKSNIQEFLRSMSSPNDFFEPCHSYEKFEIKSENNSKYPWKINGLGSKFLSVECPDQKVFDALNSMKIINSLQLNIKVLDPKKSIDFKDHLKSIYQGIHKIISIGKFFPVETFHFQANPSQNLCQTNPEMIYFWNSIFKNKENKIDEGLKIFIEHDENFWNGISDENLALILNPSDFFFNLVNLKLCFSSWLDLTNSGVKKITEFLSQTPFTKIQKLEIGVHVHSADTVHIQELLNCINTNLKQSQNESLESLTFFVFSSPSQDHCLSTLSEILVNQPKLKELSLHLRQISKSANFIKFEEALSLKLLSTLHSFRFGLCSTLEPFLDDGVLLKLYQKILKGLSLNSNLCILSIYLMSWGEVEKTYFSLQDLVFGRNLFLDVYFYGKGPNKMDEELRQKFRECAKKNKINSLSLEFLNKAPKSAGLMPSPNKKI